MKRSYISYLPAVVFDDKVIGSTGKLLFALISSLTESHGYCWASNDYLAEKMGGITEVSVSRLLGALKKRRYIVVSYENPKNNTGRKIFLNDQEVVRLIAMNQGVNPYDEPKKESEEEPINKNVKPVGLTKMSNALNKNVKPRLTKMLSINTINNPTEINTIPEGQNEAGEAALNENLLGTSQATKEIPPVAPPPLPEGIEVYRAEELTTDYWEENFVLLKTSINTGKIITESQLIYYLQYIQYSSFHGFRRIYGLEALDRGIKTFFELHHDHEFVDWGKLHYSLRKNVAAASKTTNKPYPNQASTVPVAKSTVDELTDEQRKSLASRFMLE